MFRRKKHKPRIVPGPPLSTFQEAIPPEELPETPAERIARLQLQRERSKSLKPKPSKDRAHLSSRHARKDAFVEEDGYNDIDEATNKQKSKREDVNEGPSSPPPVSVEIQIEPPLEESPVEMIGDGDDEDPVKDDEKKKAKPNTKSSDKEDNVDGIVAEEELGDDADDVDGTGKHDDEVEAAAGEEQKNTGVDGGTGKEGTAGEETAETKKEKKRRGLFARRKKEPRDASGTERSEERSAVGNGAAKDGSTREKKGADKKERGRRYLKRKDTERIRR
ncbi:hypothetical protein BIW11_09659, partial [Tropilaelaps mercedesae]